MIINQKKKAILFGIVREKQNYFRGHIWYFVFHIFIPLNLTETIDFGKK